MPLPIQKFFLQRLLRNARKVYAYKKVLSMKIIQVFIKLIAYNVLPVRLYT